MEEGRRPLDVCVIGAGPAGLCTLRHATAGPSAAHFRCVAFEQSGALGGTWFYREETEESDGTPVPSSMYSCLRTTLPREVMQFEGFPCRAGGEGRSFLHHTEVLKYLQDYAHHYNLLDHVKFYSRVTSVRPLVLADEGEGGGRHQRGRKWEVLVQDTRTNQVRRHAFDAVFVCNGHYSEPNVPPVPGLELFRGTVMHSREFRRKEAFAGRTVLVWGASSSGLDIALEICAVAKKVIVSHRVPPVISSALPLNVVEAPNVVSAYETGFRFEDGTNCDVDDFMFCTGYIFHFPFLSDDCGIQVHENRVTPLYKHLVNIEHPSMCFVGIPMLMLPFVLFDYQVRYFLGVLDGSLVLPSREEMLRDSDRDFRRRVEGLKMPPRHAHLLDWMQWEYYEDLAARIGLPAPDPVVRAIYDDTRRARRDRVMHYKTYVYRVIDESQYAVQENEKIYNNC
ncbi:flavin-containing monooxygenase FMO GS-OX-like 3 [Ischnura elegans]|uniref:flavin-containing monooxygenase FMO GS-OX-like 3 n=1 Tax=Ischnura elegans TaxID=197161 RepID=UPI001ED881EE|nr:flavin-containing monooxygenase FMO GS-OX-like 3 [Ischnura elegans]